MNDKIDTYGPIIEALLLAVNEPTSVDKLTRIFQSDDNPPDRDTIYASLKALQAGCEHRGVELLEVASGWQFRVKPAFSPWLRKLWEERPPRYSRALLETLALVAFRQPITRGEIEEVRGVAVSSHIMRTLLDREWVRIVGHKDVPGKPALFATTKAFLDYFNLKSLSDLPPLVELADLDSAGEQLEMEMQAKTDSDVVVDDEHEQTEEQTLTNSESIH
jgi:segregation and condensation protein B